MRSLPSSPSNYVASKRTLHMSVLLYLLQANMAHLTSFTHVVWTGNLHTLPLLSPDEYLHSTCALPSCFLHFSLRLPLNFRQHVISLCKTTILYGSLSSDSHFSRKLYAQVTAQPQPASSDRTQTINLAARVPSKKLHHYGYLRCEHQG